MKVIRAIMPMLLVVFSFVGARAQTDYTSKIVNPSFEQGKTGWTCKNMGEQSNNVFTLKAGNTYMEKWTGRGGSVGSGSVTQVIGNLPPGNYELTAAAQNIQEDTPAVAKTGACIFAGDQKTTVTVRDTYTVGFTYVSGTIAIGFEAVDATGNWIAVDNFQLKLVGTDLSEALRAAIEAAIAALGDATGKESQQLKDAIEAAQAVLANGNATGDEQAAAIKALEEAVDKYRRANASPDHPLDLTASIVNPSFETGDLTGWTSSGMGTQSNNVFNIKQGSWYVEKWTGKGGAVGDARLIQKLTDMKPGHYRLKAVAQNIQEDTPTKAQTGAWIFANSHKGAVTIRQDYTLDFVLVNDELEIGFEAVGATGNWIAVDNFHLEYIGDSFDEAKAELQALLEKAEQLVTQRMNAQAHEALQAAIDVVRPLLLQDDTQGWSEAARALESAYATALVSQQVFARLAEAISAACEEITSSSATQKAEFQAAIDRAQSIYDADATTDAEAEAAITALAEATFSFRILNGSGQVPVVTTDSRFIRGATWAFGRSTVKGSNILESGFCWSENPDPKVTDHRTTEYLNQAGKIYWLRDLKPATVYYMRAYAISNDYAVGYGDVIKFVTVPKGTIGYWYDNGGDDATNERLNYAVERSMNYYWNNLSSIHGFGISVHYSPGTPTADCSYGGWMRVGESSSYQQIGTIMHEAFHGIGVGTHNIWWSADMRADGNRGTWLGDRVTEAVRFWDNSATATITGDDMHLWPYGCNGAHEDTHSDNLYCMMGILAQALNEDGLPGSDAIGYALPYYSFNHEDGVKYYLKNEAESRGLRTAYLVENESHQLEWKTMSIEEATQDDAAAWYLTFTPSNQYYQLRNAATGYYMTYGSGIRTANHTSPTSADDFHLMRGRVDVDGHRGYYIIHPQSSSNPPLLNANANGKTGAANFNISKNSTTQRWLILTADEARNFEHGNIDLAKKQLEEIIALIRQLAETPHTEDVNGTDNTLNAELAAIEAEAETCQTGAELSKLIDKAKEAGMNFLSSVSVSDIEHPFDLTYMLQNPDFDNDATTGWTTQKNPGYDAQAAEFYETTFNFYQVLDDMPKGIYQLRANAFQRPGDASVVYTQYTSGTNNVNSALYINNTTATVKHICEDRQPSALFNDGGWGSDKQMTDGTWFPNCMTGASRYFAKGLYDCGVTAEQETVGGNMRLGIKGTKTGSLHWTMFDHFRLYFFGGNRTPLGINETATSHDEDGSCYDLSGRRLNSESLKSGVYIVNGQKRVVR